jgi:hypothetical protein
MSGICACGLHDRDALDKPVRALSRWNDACRRDAGGLATKHKSESEALSKRQFIALHGSEHSKRRPERPGLLAPPDTDRHSASWRSPDPEAFVSGSEAELLDGKVHAHSSIAQRLKSPRAPGATRATIIIGLDWDAQTCTRSGVPLARVKQGDMAPVKLQRDSRGTLRQWLVSWLGPVRQSCGASLYKHALAFSLIEASVRMD